MIGLIMALHPNWSLRMGHSVLLGLHGLVSFCSPEPHTAACLSVSQALSCALIASGHPQITDSWCVPRDGAGAPQLPCSRMTGSSFPRGCRPFSGMRRLSKCLPFNAVVPCGGNCSDNSLPSYGNIPPRCREKEAKLYSHVLTRTLGSVTSFLSPVLARGISCRLASQESNHQIRHLVCSKDPSALGSTFI